MRYLIETLQALILGFVLSVPFIAQTIIDALTR